MAEERFQIRKGMTVVDSNGNPVGQLRNIFSENETHRSRFINVDGRLLPVEAIQGVEQDKVKLVVPQDRFASFPTQGTEMAIPSVDEQRQAYDALGVGGPTGGP